jgi:hypothetical protein
MEETWMESTKREDAATTTREGNGIKESEIKLSLVYDIKFIYDLTATIGCARRKS